jgi:hypothetical protein
MAQGAPATLRKQLQNGDHLYAEISGANKATANTLLSSIRDVESVSAQGTGYTIRVKEGKDIRGDVAQKVVEGGYRLLELRPVAMTLEDMFLDIVGKE